MLLNVEVGFAVQEAEEGAEKGVEVARPLRKLHEDGVGLRRSDKVGGSEGRHAPRECFGLFEKEDKELECRLCDVLYTVL